MNNGETQERMLAIAAVQRCFRHQVNAIICERNNKYHCLRGNEISFIPYSR